MSVLQWNLPTVVPPDLLDPLLRKVLRLRPDLSLERTRLAVETSLKLEDKLSRGTEKVYSTEAEVLTRILEAAG